MAEFQENVSLQRNMAPDSIPNISIQTLVSLDFADIKASKICMLFIGKFHACAITDNNCIIDK